MSKRSLLVCCAVILALTVPAAIAQNTPRTPTETTRAFYQMMRDKKYREAFAMSIYQPAIDGLSAQEFEDLRPDFDRMAAAIAERSPATIDVSGEQISGDVATVFIKVLNAEGKEKIEPVTLIQMSNTWIVGDRESLDMVKKAGKKFFFEARITAHHNDVQDMMTRISLAQVLYSQSHDGKFGNPTAVAANSRRILEHTFKVVQGQT